MKTLSTSCSYSLVAIPPWAELLQRFQASRSGQATKELVRQEVRVYPFPFALNIVYILARIILTTTHITHHIHSKPTSSLRSRNTVLPCCIPSLRTRSTCGELWPSTWPKPWEKQASTLKPLHEQ